MYAIWCLATYTDVRKKVINRHKIGKYIVDTDESWLMAVMFLSIYNLSLGISILFIIIRFVQGEVQLPLHFKDYLLNLHISDCGITFDNVGLLGKAINGETIFGRVY